CMFPIDKKLPRAVQSDHPRGDAKVLKEGLHVDASSWQEPPPSSRFVVVVSLEHHEVISVDEVDKAVLLVDAPGPAARQDVAKWLRLTDAAKRVAKGLVEQPVHAPQGRLVGRLPVAAVLPAEGREDEPHHSKSWASRSSE